MTPLSELLTEHPEFAGKSLAEVRAWAQAEEAEARAEAGMLARELEEGAAAFKVLEPFMHGDTTTGAALGIMRRVEGADSPKVQAVERFTKCHPFLRVEGRA